METFKRIIAGKEFDIRNITVDTFIFWISKNVDISRLQFLSENIIKDYQNFWKTHKACTYCNNVFEVGTKGILYHKKPVCSNCVDSKEFIDYKNNYENKSLERIKERGKVREDKFLYRGIIYDTHNKDFFYLIRKAGLKCQKEFKKYTWFENYKIYLKETFVCSVCGEVFSKKERNNISKKEFCKSPKCNNEREKYNKKVVENRKETNIRNWGLDYPVKDPAVKEKIRSTQIEKYGCLYRNTEEYKEKTQNTKLERYGDIKYNNREKYKKTCQEKFGRENIFSGVEGIEIATEGMLKKHGVTNPSKMPDFKDKHNKTIEEKYGSQKKFREYLAYCQKNKFGCLAVQKHIINFSDYNPEFWLENFITEDNGSWIVDINSIAEYHGLTNKGGIIPKLKKEYPDKDFVKKSDNTTQRYIADAIDIKDKIYNDRTCIKPLEIDIFFPSKKLGIEYNDLLFHSYGYSGWSAVNKSEIDREAAIRKLSLTQEKNIELLNIFEGENLNLWINTIKDKLGLLDSKKITNWKYITDLEAVSFIKNNSLKDYKKSSIRAGGYIENNLVCVITLAKRKFGYEITNYGTLKGLDSNILTDIWVPLSKDFPGTKRLFFDKRWGNIPKFLKGLKVKLIKSYKPQGYYFLENKKDLIPETILEKEENRIQGNNLKKEEICDCLFKKGFRKIFDCGVDIYDIV